jgi:protoporphyrinogen IX oxidase
MDWISAFYLPLKVLHILSFIAWMAGLLYLPRLFVYHAMEPATSHTYALFVVMERRLLRGIMLPAKIAVFLFGGLLACYPGMLSGPSLWFWAKISLALLLAALHGGMICWWKAFRERRNTKSAVFFRWVNEIPFLIAAIMVYLVIFKPF